MKKDGIYMNKKELLRNKQKKIELKNFKMKKIKNLMVNNHKMLNKIQKLKNKKM